MPQRPSRQRLSSNALLESVGLGFRPDNRPGSPGFAGLFAAVRKCALHVRAPALSHASVSGVLSICSPVLLLMLCEAKGLVSLGSPAYTRGVHSSLTI